VQLGQPEFLVHRSTHHFLDKRDLAALFPLLGGPLRGAAARLVGERLALAGDQVGDLRRDRDSDGPGAIDTLQKYRVPLLVLADGLDDPRLGILPSSGVVTRTVLGFVLTTSGSPSSAPRSRS
jgi:hypothetical protein